MYEGSVVSDGKLIGLSCRSARQLLGYRRRDPNDAARPGMTHRDRLRVLVTALRKLFFDNLVGVAEQRQLDREAKR